MRMARRAVEAGSSIARMPRKFCSGQDWYGRGLFREPREGWVGTHGTLRQYKIVRGRVGGLRDAADESVIHRASASLDGQPAASVP